MGNDEYLILECPEGIELEIISINISSSTPTSISSNLINSDINNYITYRVYKTATGEDVTDYYGLSVGNYPDGGAYTPFEITKRYISIKTASAEKVADNTALEAKTFDVIIGKVVAGHEIYLEVTGSRTSKGVSKNFVNMKSLKITDISTGQDVTDYYNCNVELGELTVL